MTMTCERTLIAQRIQFMYTAKCNLFGFSALDYYYFIVTSISIVARIYIFDVVASQPLDFYFSFFYIYRFALNDSFFNVYCFFIFFVSGNVVLVVI